MLYALELSEEFAPILTKKTIFRPKAPAILPPSSSDGGNSMKAAHPFPMYIEAHAGSYVVVGCSGDTDIRGGTEDQLNDMEREVIRYFRALPMKCRLEILNGIFNSKPQYDDTQCCPEWQKEKKPHSCNGA